MTPRYVPQVNSMLLRKRNECCLVMKERSRLSGRESLGDAEGRSAVLLVYSEWSRGVLHSHEVSQKEVDLCCSIAFPSPLAHLPRQNLVARHRQLQPLLTTAATRP